MVSTECYTPRPGPRVMMNTIRIYKDGTARITWHAWAGGAVSVEPRLSGSRVELWFCDDGPLRLRYSNTSAKSPLVSLRGFFHAQGIAVRQVVGLYKITGGSRRVEFVLRLDKRGGK